VSEDSLEKFAAGEWHGSCLYPVWRLHRTVQGEWPTTRSCAANDDHLGKLGNHGGSLKNMTDTSEWSIEQDNNDVRRIEESREKRQLPKEGRPPPVSSERANEWDEV